jgi:hypothetical protein
MLSHKIVFSSENKVTGEAQIAGFCTIYPSASGGGPQTPGLLGWFLNLLFFCFLAQSVTTA